MKGSEIMEEDDGPLERISARTKELQDSSLDLFHASNRAHFEHMVQREWPSAWGENLRVLIYGDFNPPDAEIIDERLGITLHIEKQPNTVIQNARSVLEATLSLDDRSIESIQKAIRRLNCFLGALTLSCWGNTRVGWWSYITHGGGGGAIVDFKSDEIVSITGQLSNLTDDARQRVESALYWLRASPTSVLNPHNFSVFSIYTNHWNAFECLIEAIEILRPRNKASKLEKQRAIDDYLGRLDSSPAAKDIADLYRTIVDPGFVGKAKYALEICFEESSSDYIYECFGRARKEDRLYNIRNAINHGAIDAEDPEERMRVESRHSMLHLMLLQMFARIVQYSSPAIEGFTGRVARAEEPSTD